MTNAGPSPIIVGRTSSAIRHWLSRSGHIGLPSRHTIDAPVSNVDTSAFHIIQAVVVNHISRSPGPRSQLSTWFLYASRMMPPWPCTIAFGSPVVPDENSTHSGWSNGTGSATRSPRSLVNVSHGIVSSTDEPL